MAKKKQEEVKKVYHIQDEFSDEIIEKAEEIEEEYETENKEVVRTNEEMIRDAMLNPKYTQEERDAILNEVAEKNIKLVYFAANRVNVYNSATIDDVISAGLEGYAKAFKKIDKETGKVVYSYNPNYINEKTGQPIKFTTYAYNCIIHEIYPLLTGSQKRASREISIDTPLYQGKDGTEVTLKDLTKDPSLNPEEIVLKKEDNKELLALLNRLTPIEKFILYVRFGIDRNQTLTQKEVAKYVNMSQANISKIERTSIEYLRQIGRKNFPL